MARGGPRPRKYFPISPAAIAEAERFMREGARLYARAGEPAHPSLRQVIAHLVALHLVRPSKPPPPATLSRALKRAGVVMEHWRNRLAGPRAPRASRVQVGFRPDLCSSLDCGTRAKTKGRPTPIAHPWRLPRRSTGTLSAVGGAP